MTSELFKPEYLPPGTHVGTYVVRYQIGQGGGGVVYDVESADGHHFALKMCRYPSGPYGSTEWRMDERCTRGIQCLEQLRGLRHVAQIFAHDRFPDPLHGYQYLVQELVPGSLRITDWVKHTSPSLLHIVTVFKQLAETLGELAHADIRHRDLKPSNVLMTPDGVPKIIDFDSAICFRAEELTRRAASAVPHTHGYLSPELCLAILKERASGREEPFFYFPWSDLHALGVIFYEVLTGEHPFDIHRDEEEVLQEIAFEDPPHPMALNPAVPFGLNKVVMKLLCRNPLERYSHGNRVADDLTALLEHVADEGWTKPFTQPEHDDEPAPVQLLRITSPGVLVDVSTLKGAPQQTAVPDQPAPPTRLFPPPVWVPEPAPRRPSGWLGSSAVLAASFVVGLLGGLTWPLSPPTVNNSAAPSSGAIAKGEPVSSSVCAPLAPRPEPKRRLGRNPLLAAVACTGLACAGAKVRTDDLAWLERCPAEAKQTPLVVGFEPGNPNEEGPGFGRVKESPNVIQHHDQGCEVRDGPVVMSVSMAPTTASGWLHGTVRVGSDGASFRFTEYESMKGERHPICGVGSEAFRLGPGVYRVNPDAPGRLPESELNPNFTYITTCYLRVRFAGPKPQWQTTRRSDPTN